MEEEAVQIPDYKGICHLLSHCPLGLYRADRKGLGSKPLGLALFLSHPAAGDGAEDTTALFVPDLLYLDMCSDISFVFKKLKLS